jgi:hypothetical protein
MLALFPQKVGRQRGELEINRTYGVNSPQRTTHCRSSILRVLHGVITLHCGSRAFKVRMEISNLVAQQ